MFKTFPILVNLICNCIDFFEPFIEIFKYLWNLSELFWFFLYFFVGFRDLLRAFQAVRDFLCSLLVFRVFFLALSGLFEIFSDFSRFSSNAHHNSLALFACFRILTKLLGIFWKSSVFFGSYLNFSCYIREFEVFFGIFRNFA